MAHGKLKVTKSDYCLRNKSRRDIFSCFSCCTYLYVSLKSSQHKVVAAGEVITANKLVNG
jgi:hypothetical protein